MADVMQEIRDLLLKGAAAIEHGVINDPAGVGVLAGTLRQLVDADAFDEGMLGDRRSQRIERWLGPVAAREITPLEAIEMAKQRMGYNAEVMAVAEKILQRA